MKFEFCPKSKLYGREVFGPVDRYSFVPLSETGETEHIFCYKRGIPGKLDEPQLFRGAKIEIRAEDDITLRYRNKLEVVILMSIAADNRFRREHPEIVRQCEFFKIDG